MAEQQSIENLSLIVYFIKVKKSDICFYISQFISILD